MKTKIVLVAAVLCVAVLPAAELKVMSFNIRYGTANDGPNHWSKRKELVFDVLNDHEPDVIGLQEALRFQIDAIKKAVPGYAEIGIGRDGGEKGEYSAILYRKDRFDVLDSGTFWLSDTPEKPSISWGNTCIRICTWARFVDRKTDKCFYMYNTHLDHRSQPSREKSVRLIFECIRLREHADDPFVLTGDFNAGEDNPAILYLKGHAHKEGKTPPPALHDTFRIRHPDAKPAGTGNRFKNRSDGAKIDYVFVPPGITVLDAAIIRPEKGSPCPSDHYPVTARIIFK